MKDRRGVMRGACRECVGECDQYETPANPDDNKCQYCLCPPTKHEKVLEAETCQEIDLFKGSTEENRNESVDEDPGSNESNQESRSKASCENTSSSSNKTFKGFSGFIKGVKTFHVLQGYKYVIKTGTGSSVVRVLDTTLKGRNKWVVRFDKPHGVNVPFEHININPKMSGLGKDPHLWMPTGGTQLAQGTAKTVEVINQINKVALPVAIAVECAVIGKSVYDDVQRGTTRNSVEAVAQSAGGWTGGLGGGLTGASIGTAILPGIGTIVGGIVGSIGGGIGGALGVGAAVGKIADTYDYGMEESNCKHCGNEFMIRKYQGENRKFCDECDTHVMEIHLECETCNETFTVQRFDDGNVSISDLSHTSCPFEKKVKGIFRKSTASYEVIDTKCVICYSDFKTKCSIDQKTVVFCHSCSSSEYRNENRVDDERGKIVEMVHLTCEYCGERLFLRILNDESNSEFRHQYCPIKAKP